jgi:hypothetical protein
VIALALGWPAAWRFLARCRGTYRCVWRAPPMPSRPGRARSKLSRSACELRCLPRPLTGPWAARLLSVGGPPSRHLPLFAGSAARWWTTATDLRACSH